MTRLSTALCAIVLLLGAQAGRASTMDDLNRGVQAEAAGDHDTAIKLFTSALADKSLSPAYRALTYYNRAVALTFKEQLEQAVDDYTEALTLDPTMTDAFFNRALVESDLGKFQDAIADLDAVESTANTNPRFYYLRGRSHVGAGNYQKAVDDLNIAIAATPDNIESYQWRAKAYDMLGNFAAAVADYSTIITSNMADEALFITCYRGRGADYYALGRYAEAASDFGTILMVSPKDADATIRRALAYIGAKNYHDAITTLSGVIRADPSNPQVFIWPGMADPKKPVPDALIDQYNSAMSLPGDDPFAYVVRARAYMQQGDKEKSLADYDTALMLAQGNPAHDIIAAEKADAENAGPGLGQILLYGGIIGAIVVIFGGMGFFMVKRRKNSSPDTTE